MMPTGPGSQAIPGCSPPVLLLLPGLQQDNNPFPRSEITSAQPGRALSLHSPFLMILLRPPKSMCQKSDTSLSRRFQPIFYQLDSDLGITTHQVYYMDRVYTVSYTFSPVFGNSVILYKSCLRNVNKYLFTLSRGPMIEQCHSFT